MKPKVVLLVLAALFACKNDSKENPQSKTDISDISTKEFTEFKVEDSKYINKDHFWKPFEEALLSFTEEEYKRIYPMVYDQDIPSIQKHIIEGQLTYESLVKFYLYRIKTYDRFNNKSLNSIMALNPNIIEEAQTKDRELKNHIEGLEQSVYGIPILLKDNVNAQGMSTTAGAVALIDNKTDDAYIVKTLKRKGALILGKANLSEWAYFFCGDCPSGYSAVGGQTFNPYGKKKFDTGGSSSGSAVAVSSKFLYRSHWQ